MGQIKLRTKKLHQAETELYSANLTNPKASNAFYKMAVLKAKRDLVQALKDAFGYCDKIYDGMTDAAAPEMVKFLGRDMPKLGVLAFSNMHNYEHYGNIVTYMRLRHIVPPSSETASP